uniref:FecR family protein n=1 Tax=Pedobacter schmidteae TaxID=2201271 RepID=UPI000EB38F9A|nr:FecR family protein [Pedobacter schmidteae]
MEHQEIISILNRYKTGDCSKEELALLESWYLQHDENAIKELSAEEFGNDLLLIAEGLPLQSHPPVSRKWNNNLFRRQVGIAAAILLIAGMALLFFANGGVLSGLFDRSGYANDLPPGKNKAVLTLANGKRINLSDAKNGIVIDASILAYNDGTQIQTGSENGGEKNDELQASTPAGGTYQVMLADGTKVWMNSETVLKFPQSFTGKERRVELIGEAYFEVAKSKTYPFIVKSRQQEVTVLGTHFNISAYENDRFTKTTLLEGAVSVMLNDLQKRKNNSGFALLSPGKQALSTANTLQVKETDVEEAVSWKNGYFRFNDEKLQSVMQKIARWYDIEVVYKDQPTQEGFTGTISRTSNISDVLDMLERTKTVHFEIEGRRVTVMN